MERTETPPPPPGKTWPGLWVPLVILLAGLATTALTAHYEASRARMQAETRYQAQHQMLVNLVRAQQWANASQASDTDARPGDWLSPVINQALPDHMGVRLDTLARHTKQPLLHIRTETPVDPSRALRSEIRSGDANWMLTTLPAKPLLEQEAAYATRRIWASGLFITALAVLLVLWLCRRLYRATRQAHAVRQQSLQADRQINNLQTEKTILRQALDDSERRSRDLVALSGAILCELDENGVIGFASPQSAELIGEAPSDLTGRRFEDLIDPEDQDNFHRTLASARRDHTLERVDLSLRHRDEGITAPVTLRVLALQDPLHGLAGFRISASPLHGV
ncbi:PAS domain-containing protein [Marinobacter salinisoli]|uniref:PAS domain-containing protein n=1 Tax=Marinobacter salinisoli TaxID=2769486 RepID=A0ABX7MYZ7_9GAMM|nr:PAS domain-containing protein [Marinobacter salinisoli]QSP95418.1 PAS domain-containing protein [Marinobacter salinisoli]